MKYDKDYLLFRLVHFKWSMGRVPRARDLTSKNGMPSAGTYRNYFGSLTDALILADLVDEGSRDRPNLYDDDYLLNSLIRFRVDNGKFPIYTECNSSNNLPNARTYAAKFGSFDKAIDEARKKIKEIK